MTKSKLPRSVIQTLKKSGYDERIISAIQSAHLLRDASKQAIAKSKLSK